MSSEATKGAVWTDRVRARAGRWAPTGRERIGVEGMLIAVPMRVLGRRAGQVGLEQADSVLTALSGFVALATVYRALVYRRPDTGPSPAGPLVRPWEEVRRHAAREAGTGCGV
ncbi:hypothetical protein ACIQV3_39260 [Streptomyces sp. NPDC099050]|uniref:hypothetical protein n=1 Tax=Streptomyces sp. NPDC099050 TaxID=3366100 RepID=UPI003807262F